MHIINSLFTAFLMYSRIPMPNVEWNEENRRYSLCFFPLIGGIIGGLILLWYKICIILNLGGLIFASVCVAVPILVTGGIHLDGFCDVCDAKASCCSRNRMLEIMSDSHIGAFAAIKLGVYLLLQTGIFFEIYEIGNAELMQICALTFIQSRALSGIAAVIFRCAKDSGTLRQLSKPAHKAITIAVEIFFVLLTCTAMLIINLICGIGAVVGATLTFLYYRIFSYKMFDGITGDLAGYFLQLCELVGPGFAVLACAIGKVFL